VEVVVLNGFGQAERRQFFAQLPDAGDTRGESAAEVGWKVDELFQQLLKPVREGP
jgi:hypothetical protein